MHALFGINVSCLLFGSENSGGMTSLSKEFPPTCQLRDSTSINNAIPDFINYCPFNSVCVGQNQAKMFSRRKKLTDLFVTLAQKLKALC